MPLGWEVGLGPSDIVLDGDPVPLPQKGGRPQFLAHICCGQMAGWIKMAFGMEVGLSPGHIVLDGDPAPPLSVPRTTTTLGMRSFAVADPVIWNSLPAALRTATLPSDVRSTFEGPPVWPVSYTHLTLPTILRV